MPWRQWYCVLQGLHQPEEETIIGPYTTRREAFRKCEEHVRRGGRLVKLRIEFGLPGGVVLAKEDKRVKVSPPP